MCGRFTLGVDATTLAAQFGLFEPPAWTPRYNIAPTQEVLVVVRPSESTARQGRLLRWGLIPGWAEGPAVGSRMINARAETVATKPAFRTAFRERRCLVLADGFYEWQKQAPRKQPFYIHCRDDQPFAFAGLWERWVPPEGQPVDSCTILTTVANDLIRPLHLRMPVILAPEAYTRWLDPIVHERERLQPLLCPYPAEEMTAYPVSTRVNSPTHDSPALVEPLPSASP